MRAPAKRTAMLGLAALAVLAAILILVFSGGDHGPRQRTRIGPPAQSDIQVAAAYLGIGTVDLRRRLRFGLTLAQVADTTKGTSSEGLLHALLQARATPIEKRGLPAGEEQTKLDSISRRLKQELQRARRGHGSGLALTSSYLGIEDEALVARLASGKSLAEIASATPGKSRSGLIEALTERKERRLRRAAAGHRITNAAAQKAIEALQARTANEVDRKGAYGGS